jgi:putative DNA primase/helicase
MVTAMTVTVRSSPAPEEERPRRLRIEAERLARLPTVEWMYYVALDGYVDSATLKKTVDAVIKETEKKRQTEQTEQRRAEQKQEREDKRARQDEAQARKEAEHAVKEAERAVKEAERVKREEEAKQKKREAVFAEIADLPKLTHETRLREAAKRLKEDYAVLVEEFTIYCAKRTIPEDLEPWPDPVNAAELLAEIEAKFRRYVVAPDAIVTASVLWGAFTYLVEIAVYAPKLVFTFPERDAGKSAALDVLRWIVQRGYPAVEVTGAVLFRIIDRLRPTPVLDEADSLFERRTVLAFIMNASWANNGVKIPRTGSRGEIVEYDIYGTQLIGMRGMKMPDTTASRCIICLVWPKLASEVVEEFDKLDDAEFKTIRRKLQRLAVDNAVALKAAAPEFPPGFNNRVRMNWKMLFAIADLAGGEWSARARKAALELEVGRDEPSENKRLFAALRDVWGNAKERTSESVCKALAGHPSGEWANFRGKGPINQIQLAALLRPFGIRPIHGMHPTKRSTKTCGGYRRSQFEDAWKRLL